MLKTELCGLALKNPLLLSSGVLDLTAPLMKRAYENGAAAVITKGVGLTERTGHPNPTIIGTDNYLMNAVGLSNPSIFKFKDEIKELKKNRIPTIVNIYAENAEKFAKTALKAQEYGADAVELNVSCPNITKDEMVGQIIGKNPSLVEEITRQVKETVKIPVIAKLSPNVDDIAVIARAAEKGGADAVSAINTVSGMLINIEAKRPILANKSGGVSGPAIKPIAINAVYQIYEAVKIPIIGVGGITTGRDAIEMLMAGATAVAIGSAVYYRGLDVFRKIENEMLQWIKENNTRSIKDMIGVAHK